MREDAARNRQRLLDEASALFAEQGISAPLDELARRAHVSSGTVYRHFPTRTDLVRALYDRIVDRTDLLMEVVVAEPSGWQAIVAQLDGVVGLIWEFPEAPAVIAHMRQEDPTYRPGDQWIAPMVAATQRAQREGTLREDASPTDVAYLPHLLGQLVAWPEPQRGLLLARMRAVLLDGLRPAAATRERLPTTPLSIEQLRALSENAMSPFIIQENE